MEDVTREDFEKEKDFMYNLDSKNLSQSLKDIYEGGVKKRFSRKQFTILLTILLMATHETKDNNAQTSITNFIS